MNYSNKTITTDSQNGELNCAGCGVVKQTNDNQQPGFINDLSQKYCLRCFKLKNHNELINYELPAERFQKLLNTINEQSDVHYFYVLDLFDLMASRNATLERIISNRPVTLVINKIDLLVKLTTIENMLEYVKHCFASSLLEIDKIFFVSSVKNYGLDALNNYLHQNSAVKKYFVGCTNVGKSSLINGLLKLNASSEFVTVSNFQATTLGVIPVVVTDECMIFDTPGLINPQNIVQHLAHNRAYKQYSLVQKLRPTTFQLLNSQSIVLGQLGIVSFVGEGRISFHCYFNNNLDLHRTNYLNRIAYFDAHSNDDNTLRLNQNTQMVSTKFKVVKNRFQAIAIFGLGWVSFKPETNCEIEVYLPKNVKVDLISKPLV